jgi:NADH:ubiquinone reductase (H+-translocating)
VDVTLIDRRNFHLFQPLLYQVATGSLSPGEISAPLRSILSRQENTRVLLGEAADVDPGARRVTLCDGGQFEYDSLIVATGSETAYYGHDEWREWAPSLKSVEEATAIRHKILYAFEAAERTADLEERRAWMTFVIVGGGATGVELAGALGEIARQTLRKDFRSIHSPDASILLVDASPRVLPSYPESLSARAERALIRLGVRVMARTQVLSLDGEGVRFRRSDGSTGNIPSKTVLWAGGVAGTEFGHALARRTGAETDKAGRMLVRPDLTIPGHPDIFIIGDLAAAPGGPQGKPLPGVAQVAMQGGAYAAHVIQERLKGAREIKPFRYFNKGELAVIGRGAAVANIFGLRLWGLPAWLAWLFVHLMYLVEFQSRVLVFIQWGFQYITFSRGARLITGETVLDRERNRSKDMVQ